MAHGWRKYSEIDRSRLGPLVRSAREELGLSLRQLSEKAGFNEGYRAALSSFETGQRDLPQTERKPYRRRVLCALVAEARARKAAIDLALLWSVAGLEPEAGFGSRVLVIRDAGSARAVEGGSLHKQTDPPGPPGPPRPDYGALMAEGHRASERQEPDRARRLYAHAAAAAVLPGDAALALARQAYATRRLGELAEAWQVSNRALATLELADFAPERGHAKEAVRDRIADEPTLRALTMATRVRMHVALDRDEFSATERCADTLSVLGEIMGSAHAQANAELFRGRVDILKGTDLGGGGEFLRIIDPARIHHALARIDAAGRLGSDYDDSWQAHYLHQRARAVRLLRGGDRVATRAESEAREAFGQSRAIANLDLAQAQFGLGEGNGEARIATLLTSALEHAQAIGSRLLVADAMGTFAELFSRSQKTRLEAIAFCLAGLAVWPPGLTTRGIRRLQYLYADLDVEPRWGLPALASVPAARAMVDQFGVGERIQSFLSRSASMRR